MVAEPGFGFRSKANCRNSEFAAGKSGNPTGGQRRRIWSEGRTLHSGADRARGISVAAPGENNSYAPRIDAAPRKAASHGFEIQSGSGCAGESAGGKSA